jgi:hyperosmotically inducible periplasmic protein
MNKVMSMKTVTAALVGVVLVFGYGYQTSASGQAASSGAVKIDDDSIQDRIEASLKADRILAPRNIDVDVDHGVVTLTGTVRTAEEKAAARRIADVAGVTQVRNRIDVDPKVDESKIDAAAAKTKSGISKAVDATAAAARKSKDALQKGVGKTEEGVAKAAGKTSDAADKVAEKSSDASITSGVKAAFYDETLLQGTAIDIETTDQVVTLRGTVRSFPAKARAEELARKTKNVVGVVNQLVVRE